MTTQPITTNIIKVRIVKISRKYNKRGWRKMPKRKVSTWRLYLTVLRAMSDLDKICKAKNIQMNTKLKLYKVLIMPISTMYGCET